MADFRESVLALGPALYWPLNSAEGANDHSGNGRNGTAEGGVVLGGNEDSPILGDSRSTDFDGADDRVASSYSPFAGDSTISVIGWANRDTSTSNDALFSGTGTTPPFLWLASGGNNVVWQARNGGGNATTFTSGWPGNTQWVFFALVFNDATNSVSLYTNGALKETKEHINTYSNAGNFVAAGFGLVGSVTDIDGKMAHVAVFTKALTGEQIEGLYAAREGTPTPPSIGSRSLMGVGR